MLIKALTIITVCLQIYYTVAIQDYITNYKNITASSVSHNSDDSYDPWNVVDRNSGTLPDECNCCWASFNDNNPTIHLQLQHPTVISFIEILGRTEMYLKENQRLSGINILIDGYNRDIYQHYDPTNNRVTVRMPPERASNITINRPKTSVAFATGWFLIICEIKMYRSVNTADRATVTVSSTLSYGGMNYNSKNVIDGNNHTLPDVCDCCWASSDEITPKLTLLLVERSPVMFIEVIGRTDRTDAPMLLSGTNIIVDESDKSPDQTMEGNNIYLTVRSSQPVRNITVVRPSPTGQTEWFLIICEIKVFSLECPSSYYYESGCTECGHCLNGSQCNTITGECSNGCQAGYVSPMCSTVCTNGTFGRNCADTCSPNCYASCNTVSGICIQGCKAGFMGTFCNTTCNEGNYGVNCTYKCSVHCMGGYSNCDTVNGTCTSGCLLGYTGVRCDQDCPDTYYGLNCSERCSSRCQQSLCDNIAGECSNGCVDGYKGHYCNETCRAGTYGVNCTKTCGLCKGDIACNNTNGVCENGCEPGYNGTTCAPCPVGYYGDGCGNICHCEHGVDCLKNNGSCPQGCDFGWSGDSCSIDLNIISGNRQNISVSQSSVFMINETLYGPQNAIDGIEHNDIEDTCGCCSVTNDTNPGAWWQINLGQQYLVYAIQIYESSSGTDANEQLQNAIIYAGNTSLTQNQHVGVEIYTVPVMDINTRQITKILDTAIISQYFIVRLYQGMLTLCEFKLFRQVCDVGRFGVGCNHMCHCSDHLTCNPVTGECQISGCHTGWNGSACDQECVSPAFGYKCTDTCHCLNGTYCDHVTGHCDLGECDPGWHGDSCNQECASPTFGESCRDTCHCESNSHCDHVTGICVVGTCDSGWQGESCNQKVMKSSESDSDNTAAIAGGVVAVVLVLFVVVIIVILYKRKKGPGTQPERDSNYFTDLIHPPSGNAGKQPSAQGNISSSYEETRFDSKGDYDNDDPSIGIKKHQLWNYIHYKMNNGCEKFYAEFTKLPYGLVHECEDAVRPDNMGKNNYREMYAYDHTRVKLDVTGTEEGDYINACYINGFDKVKKFVASQGPWKNMIKDFWRLVWQIKTDKIIMLTNLEESGTYMESCEMCNTCIFQTKCLQYWPDEDENHYGNVCVKLVRTETCPDFNVRYLRVSKGGESTRKIRQFHFKSWPDKEVPDNTWCLVNFLRVVDTKEVTGAGPLLVHGSAGVGRTGTFIALDNLMSQCKSGGCIRPLQMIQSLREQRVNMVQTKEQYVYLHEAVADGLFIGTHHIWTKHFQEVYMYMLHNEKDATESAFEIQFNLIERGLEETIADDNNVEYYNESTLVSICDAHKPRLQKTGTVIAPQLGAVYMQNYNGDNTFILTQSPTKSTIEEFLTLIGEHKIKTVLVLTEGSSPEYKDICQLHTTSVASRFTVNKIDENIEDNLIEQSFSYKHKDEGRKNPTTIKQFLYPAWKDNGQVPDDTASFIDYLETVLRWQPQISESQPVLIHCGNGQNRSGLTYVVLNELLRIRNYSRVNIVDTVTKMKQRSRQMVAGYEQYRYCYDFILAYINYTQVYNNL